jgi:hypothetical protein
MCAFYIMEQSSSLKHISNVYMGINDIDVVHFLFVLNIVMVQYCTYVFASTFHYMLFMKYLRFPFYQQILVCSCTNTHI